mgnify:CR=1 FL=1
MIARNSTGRGKGMSFSNELKSRVDAIQDGVAKRRITIIVWAITLHAKRFVFFKYVVDHRDLPLSIRRQRRMCIRDSLTADVTGIRSTRQKKTHKDS